MAKIVVKHYKPRLAHYYGRELTDFIPGAFEFRLELIRGKGLAALELDTVATSFEWLDEGSVMTGSMSLQRPDPEDASSLPIANGHRVRCSVRWAGRWYRLWTMRVDGVPDVTLETGAVDVTLKDDLEILRRSKQRWRFRKTKNRKHGWLPHEVAREVAKRTGLVLGSIAKGKYRTSFSMVGSGLDAIKKAYAHEREKSGVMFVLRIRDGRLEVLPVRRNTILYVLEEQITSALVHGEQTRRPVTIIRARGKIGKGKDAKKVKFSAYNGAVVRRFGRTEEEWDAGTVTSLAELKERANRRLANKIRVRRTADLTTPGIPFIRRGDGVRWRTREAGWHGATKTSLDRSFVFVTSARHTVQAGAYTSAFSVQQTDPYVQDKERRDKEARAKARAKRKKKKA